MDLLIPNWQQAPKNVGAFTTIRVGGYSGTPYDDGTGHGGLNLGGHVEDNAEHVHANRQRLLSVLPAEPRWLRQVHGTTVVDAATVVEEQEADACIATQADVVCAILTADCLPVFLCDTQGRVIGAAHAGWRGLAAGVLENTVTAMHARGADDIIAWLGPAIGPACFEVGKDVVDAFVDSDSQSLPAFTPFTGREGKYLSDIYLLARLRLARVGVQKVYGGEHCTVTGTKQFYSYRRDGRTGRMASLIWLKSNR